MLETVHLVHTQSIQNRNNLDISNTEQFLNSQQQEHHGDRQVRQTFPAQENYQQSLAELTQQKQTKSGNSLHRLFSDKMATEDGARRGGRGQSRPSFISSSSTSSTSGRDRSVGQQRPREDFCCIRRPHIISAGYGKVFVKS